MTWRQRIRKLMDRELAELPVNASKMEIKAALDRSWPSKESRVNHPYKIWLSERKKLYYEFGILEKPPEKAIRKGKKSKEIIISPGQLSLFK